MTQVRPGWYPDSRDPEVFRWWDGSTWTAYSMTREALAARGESPAPRMPQQPRPALGGRWGALALVVQGMLLLSGLAGAAGTAVFVWSWQTARAWRAAPSTIDVDIARLVDRWGALSSNVDRALLLATAVLLIVWLYRAHRSDRMDPARLHHSSGWAIFGWFVPILLWWRPLQMVRDVARGARGSDGSVPAVLGWWWALWIAASLTVAASFSVAPLEDAALDDYLAGLTRVYAWEAVGEALYAAAAIAALLVVRTLTRRVQAAGRATSAVPSA